ncbi:hypothetical protein E4U56_007366 [Claviceps arundinis]|uniref:Deoxyribonuclease NucA/NucB domain-containing protein n=1 Tax=Claviceps arundinis TaxID=1623583 RepID=A0A9P7SU21_9HYPO|nr:hypothetical protein E4U56_007366 [Claviceps arundinis]
MLPHSLLSLLRAVCIITMVFATSLHASESPPDITFNCKRMPEICTNMCWAMRCAQPRFPQTLTWDSSAVKHDVMMANLKASGCSVSGNRCRDKHGLQGHVGGVFFVCDEYPFFFTSESSQAGGHAVSRCVRRTTNKLQGKQLRAMFEPWQQNGLKTHKLQIALQNPGHRGVNYCLNQPCVNDGFEIQDGMAKPGAGTDRRARGGLRGREAPTPAFRFFKTQSGAIVASMEPLVVGMNFTTSLDDEDGDDDGTGGEKDSSVLQLDFRVDEAHGERIRRVSDVVLEEVSAEITAGSSFAD